MILVLMTELMLCRFSHLTAALHAWLPTGSVESIGTETGITHVYKVGPGDPTRILHVSSHIECWDQYIREEHPPFFARAQRLDLLPHIAINMHTTAELQI